MTGRDDAVWLDERHRSLLVEVLRSRSSSLAELTRPDLGGDVLTSLHRLRDAGFVEIDGDVVTAVPPDAAVAGVATAALGRQRESLAALTRLVRQLPSMSRAWDMGQTPHDYDVRGEVIEGDERATQRWASVTQQRPPLDPGVAYGHFDPVHEQLLPHLAAAGAASQEAGARMRVILPADQLGDTANREACDTLVASGVDVRLATTVPTWLYVDSGVMAGIPLRWGAPGPHGFVLVYDPALIDAVGSIFDRWWTSATPWPMEPAGWLPVMRLLARGRTDEQVAAILGMGVRTVRRRIAEAMTHFGVSSRFELGMHWAQRSRPHNHVALDLDMGQLPARPVDRPAQSLP
ncbi:hypothetical protein HN031_02240 [Nocardioides sp. zg-1308]|uniref:LuxR C-terminal-related transcriptional regulator n=1 Tax=Nocardioides renjunii TaxID=3095075 RepID=A0ABU5K616_9ACTN|nr:LuxR C-terminal-related transcriptional regulator [Nocardioides sp. S-58]MDZ5660393.1 LuxR C-terminal-related transcriptional regulator [Nocardioides sp. S-58]NPD03503.1 hypothetical protein [Nocardioides sp. zg-1308]